MAAKPDFLNELVVVEEKQMTPINYRLKNSNSFLMTPPLKKTFLMPIIFIENGNGG